MKSWLRAVKRLILPPRPASISPAHQAYGEWWSQAAQTVRDARVATIDDLTEDQYIMRGLRGDANSPGAVQLLEWTGTPADGTARVLELGCGIARIGREMARMVAEWHGADISASMIGHARGRTQHLPNVFLHHLAETNPASLGSQPFAARPFDMVYCTVVLMHLDKEDLFAYLLAMHDLLKPGAPAYFDTWNICHPDTFRIWREAAVVGDGKPRGRIQGSSPEEFLVYLHKAGFDVERLDRNEKLVRAVVRRPLSAGVRAAYPGAVGEDRSAGRSSEGDTFAPFGYVTIPRTGDTVVGPRLELNGFALDGIEGVRVEVEAGAGSGGGAVRVVEAQIHLPRTDIPNHFPEYEECGNCGWAAEVDLSGLPGGLVHVRAIARDRAGLETDLAGVDLTVHYRPE